MDEASPTDSVSASTHPWRRAALWLALLGPFFFATYAFANWIASQRAYVPSIVFDWERSIPFWPWTIVPYWIIDVLYGVSLFLCTSRRELDTHALRLLTAQIIAVACFLAFPHRFTFEHPPASGAFGTLFDLLLGFDRPFNQLPSLHIALAVILWTLYARKTQGAMRIAVDGAFVLICASVLTTYQHHFIDIPTGAALGWLCVFAWPDDPAQSPWRSWSRTRDVRRLRLAAYYLLGAVACLSIANAGRGAPLWLLWPALSLTLQRSQPMQPPADRILRASRALLALHFMPGNKAGRSIEMRCRGALRLLRLLGVLVIARGLLTAVAAASLSGG